MKRRILEIALAFTIGAFTCCESFAIYGIVAVYSIEKHLIKWIYYLPKSYRAYGFLVHGIVEHSFSAIPLIALLGGALGLIINKGPTQYGIVAVFGAISFYIFISFIYLDFVYVGIMFLVDIIKLVLWTALFILFANIGYRLRKRKPTA